MFDFLQKLGVSVELAELLEGLGESVKRISQEIVRTDPGKVGTKNAYGEVQAALDLKAEEILSAHLKACPFVAAYGSEELDEMAKVHTDGKYAVFYDPLDGSSLIDVNFAMGTIVGIYEGSEVLGRTPREQVAALYGLYGPRTILVLTVGKGVHEFVLREGVWQLETEDLQLSGDKAYFAPGNLRASKEREDYFEYVQGLMRAQHTLRYSGGMVPDLHHILKKGGGIFTYPGMPSAPDGKLRLLYECGPMAMILEQAGGAADTGDGAILDLKIESLEQRTPILIGEKKAVQVAARALPR